jgi:hypothetical protein
MQECTFFAGFIELLGRLRWSLVRLPNQVSTEEHCQYLV